MLKPFVKKLVRRSVFLVVLILCGAWGYSAHSAWVAQPLELWHTYVPRDLTASEMETATWQTYLARENSVFDDVRQNVTMQLPEEAKTLMNRYHEHSLIYPPRLLNDWNRSYLFYPEGNPKGVAVFLHGLTDTPYSLRHVAAYYRERGFIALGIRLPGHGTVPAALTSATWQDWMAATHLAVREAVATIGPEKPLHLVGFSTGGALAVKYTLETLEDSRLHRPDRVILISPMIGITRFARFVGIAAVPAILPPFAQAAWLSILPEFNPFKYNSFPTNGARQAYLLSATLQKHIVRLSTTEAFATLPPFLTFQSVLDYTVSTPAVLYHLYAYLPQNGSELVLYDVNQAALLNKLMRPSVLTSLQRMLPGGMQRYTLSIVKNRDPRDQRTMLVTQQPGQLQKQSTPLEYHYPKEIFSLSHGAVPFPENDPLYGLNLLVDEGSLYGVNLGSHSLRGERGGLVVPMDAMLRLSASPFFPLLIEQVGKAIDDPRPPAGAPQRLPSQPPPSEAVNKLIDAFLKEHADDAISGATVF